MTISSRYQLQEPLGQGGMGIVYRAYDRLTGQTVALKQVMLTLEKLHTGSHPHNNDRYQLLLSLAQEFKFLASLRHPNIISVFDYGFDSERRPYFTMELLEEAQTLREAGRAQPLAVQVELLIQTLQALAYLHRRNILHHDLKPENVLVSKGRVRVLDFGLSMPHEHIRDHDYSGTLLYLPPEIFLGATYTFAADLYAVGIMAYELLVGRHPFCTTDLDQFLEQLINDEPDLNLVPTALAAVLAKLLSKQPTTRYQDAEQVIGDLCSAIGAPPWIESQAVRESFLQAATFVGRDSELLALSAALGAAQRGHGSAWLVGGESGVGKSRLLDELRTHALVEGVLVLRGQAVEGVGLPYQLWREPLRRLVLNVAVSDLEASILMALVPDIANLLERPITAIAPLEGAADQQRLNRVIVELCQRQTQPTLLLMEDLQWTVESLELLQALMRLLPRLPWLIVTSYRDEERRGLPSELPEAHVVKLNRLREPEIAALSAAILGTARLQPQVLALIQRESEGNTFFVVEVVRVLAEEAGRLSAIGDSGNLPPTVLAGGIQQVMRRHLARVPLWAQAALKLAAVAGRQLDPQLLMAAMPELDWDAWLTAGANAAILDVADGQWRFAHDKLRATILADLEKAERALLHGRVAQALETVYPRNIAYAETLAEHWEQAGEPAKALHYLIQAVDRYIHITANYVSAEALLDRGLRYADPSYKAVLLRLAGEARRYQDDLAGAIAHYMASLQLNSSDLTERAASLNGLSSTLQRQGRYAEAATYAQQALAAAHTAHDSQNLALGLYNAGAIADALGEFELAKEHYAESLALWQTLGNAWGRSKSLSRLGVIASKEGKRQTARACFEESLQIDREIGDRTGVIVGLMSLGILSEELGEFTAAQHYYGESLQEAQAIGDRQFIALGQYNLGCCYINAGDYPTALPYFQASLPIFEEIDDRGRVALVYANLGFVAYAENSYATAREYLVKSIQIEREIGEREMLAVCQAELALILLQLGDIPTAQVAVMEALQLAQAVAMPAPQARALLAAAYLAHAIGEDRLVVTWLGVLRTSGMLEGRSIALLQTLTDAIEVTLGSAHFVAAVAQGATGPMSRLVQNALDKFSS